jgi:hypothetical protein
LGNNYRCRNKFGWVNVIFGYRAGLAGLPVDGGLTVNDSGLGFERMLARGGSRFGAYGLNDRPTPRPVNRWLRSD